MGKKAEAAPAAAAATPAPQESNGAPPAKEPGGGGAKDVDAIALEAANRVLADEATQLDELAKGAEDAVKGANTDQKDEPKEKTEGADAASEPDTQTAVFLRQKKLEQKQRERMAAEQQAWEARKRDLEQREQQWVHRARQLEERETLWNKMMDEGDVTVAAQLMNGRDPRRVWETMAKASDPAVQQQAQWTERERAIMAKLERMEGYVAEQQNLAAQAEEARLEGLAIEHMFDEESCPTICAHLNPKHPVLREVALKLYKDTAKRYVDDNGVFDLRGVAIEVEKEMRRAYAAEHKGSSQTRTPSGANMANGTAKPTSLSVSKLAGRESVPKSVDDMSEEERTRVAIEAANRMMRTA